MTVQDGAGRVNNGVMLIVTICQHRVDTGDGSTRLFRVAGALNELRNGSESGRRIASCRSRLPKQISNLPSGMGHPR